MIVIKSKEEIELLRVPCRVTGELLNKLAGFIKPGISTWEIDNFCAEFIKQHGMTPTFKGYGGFAQRRDCARNSGSRENSSRG